MSAFYLCGILQKSERTDKFSVFIELSYSVGGKMEQKPSE